MNDDVMSDVSENEMRAEPDIGVFSGELALENGGGFASVRRTLQEYRLAGYKGLRTETRGDGRHYQLRLRTHRLFEFGKTYVLKFSGSSRSDIRRKPFLSSFGVKLLSSFISEEFVRTS
ncbi:CIA30 family protein [Halomonas sp. PR-M31]|uniref:CIA30 family protein n=1 Tax=Halomonas sp. PR-M31 TaxID=1471202 RepID=UPI002646432E|nr:CIA30 family protein [Halomonas sp. PR-M31]